MIRSWFQREEPRPWWRPAADYWESARAPWSALVFVTPLVLVYELGRWLLGTQRVSSGADAMLRRGLGLVGLNETYWLPLILAISLVVWQLVSRARWRVRFNVWGGMAVESVAWAVLLVVVARGHWEMTRLMLGGNSPPAPGPIAADWCCWLCYTGAGVYEEVLFRLAALPMLALVARRVGCPYRASIVLAIVASSLGFAAAHHAGVTGEVWDFPRFSYRALAGAYLALVFRARGFGVAAGTHVAYDLLATCR